MHHILLVSHWIKFWLEGNALYIYSAIYTYICTEIGNVLPRQTIPVHVNHTPLQKTHVAMPSSGDLFTTLDMTRNDKNTEIVGKLKISTVVERPAIMKKCG